MGEKVTGSELIAGWRNFKSARETLAAYFLEYTWQIAWLNTHDDELAEEVAQEASLRAIEKAPSFQPRPAHNGDGLPAWLSRIVRNIIIDKLEHDEKIYLPKEAYKRWVRDFIYEVLEPRVDIKVPLRQQLQSDLLTKTSQGFQRLTYSAPDDKRVLKEIQGEHRTFFRAFGIEEVPIYIVGAEGDEQELELPGGLQPEAVVETQIARHCLWQLINHLDHPTRKELAGRYQVEAALFFIANFTQQKIAEELGLTHTQVRNDFAKQIRPQMRALLQDPAFLAQHPECHGLLSQQLAELP